MRSLPISRAEMLGSLVLILIAGLDTVWNVLSNSLLYLAGAPADRRRLAADPALIPQAVEEFPANAPAVVVGTISQAAVQALNG